MHMIGLRSNILLIISFLALVSSACKAQEAALAFPGAEGFGKNATGGRGGKVIYVTNLNDDGPGSLRKAIRAKGPRIVVFAVSGNIELKSPLDINNDDITIAGQSAPGDGICIKNYPVSVKANNVIIRFLRFRLGDQSGEEADAISGNSGVNNVIIDHCSMSWATDEGASFYRNKNFTLQWCIISESLNSSVHEKGDHGYGGIWGGEGATFHHNLLASHTSRLPRFSGSKSTPNSKDELVDFVNNVIYNWRNNNTYGGEAGRYNIIGNYYKPGPATRKAKDQIINPWEPAGKFFVRDNLLLGNDRVSEDNHLGIKADAPIEKFVIDKPFPTERINIEAPAVAFENVLRHAGASLKRDAVDIRVIDEVRKASSASGKEEDGIIDSQKHVGGWPELKTGPVRRDSDQDGMPDDWEKNHGLNPDDPADGPLKTLSKAYTNLEVYLNDLVKDVTK